MYGGGLIRGTSPLSGCQNWRAGAFDLVLYLQLFSSARREFMPNKLPTFATDARLKSQKPSDSH